MADLLATAVSGLLSYQRALNTTSHNIANVNTPGYSRQRVEMSAAPPQYLGGNYVGTGVQVERVRRVYDEFLAEQVRTSTSLEAQHRSMHDLALQIDNMLADTESGIAPAMQEFFDSLQDLSTDPASTAARQVVLSQGESLTARFNDLAARLDALREGVNTNLTVQVDEINTLAAGLADVNEDILNAPTGPSGAVSGDLLDRRDQLLNELSELVSVTTLEQSDGTLNVFIGTGQSLVSGTSAQRLDTATDPYDPTRLRVSYVGPSGTSVDITSQITGGKLGGTLEFRDQVLDPAINQLGRVAIGLAESFNDQHALGQDLDGNLGGDFFATASPEVLPHSGNTGDGDVGVSIADASALTTSNYRLERSGTDYSLVRLSDGAITDLDAGGFPGGAVTVDGLEISLSPGTTIDDGDTYLLRPTRTAAEDLELAITHTNDIAAAAPVRTAAAVGNTGTAKVSAGTVDAPPPVDVNLQQTVTITFDDPPTTFDVSGTGTGNPTDVAYTSGAAISYNGWTIQITGTPAAGDSFTIEANDSGVSDNRNALLLAQVHESESLDGGTTSLVEAYGGMVAEVGARTHRADLSQKAHLASKDQAIAAHQAVSGVNLDEEAANLIRYQQAYQAAAQAISVTNTLFQSILSAVGR